MVEIHLIIIFMIAAAIVAVAVKDLLSSVVAIGAVGIGLSMAFLILKAPDLAIMQLVIEIISLIILIRATIRKDLPFSASGRWVFNTSVALIFFAALLTAAFYAFKDIPQFGNPTMKLSENLMAGDIAGAHGVKNIVAALTLHHRSFDALGEVAAFFTAVIGVLAIAREVGRKGK